MPLRNLLFSFLLFFAVAATLSWQRGSFQAEFGDYPDESGHYVTGLMIRDFVASGIPTPPMQYAENYYRHYPKVALGHWPPVFYVVEAAWMLIFSVSRSSVVLLMSAQAAALALVLHKALSRDLPEVWGTIAGLFLLSLPLVQRLGSAVMSELLVALLVFIATLSFGDYLDFPDARRATAFGIAASLAILTKGTAFVLALVPPISVLLTWRIGLVRKLSFWLPAAIVLTVCGPWYFLAPAALHQDVAKFGGIYVGYYEAPGFFKDAVRDIGLLPLIFAGVGLCCGLLTLSRKQAVSYRWAATAALFLGFLVFRCFVGAAAEPRHLIIVVLPTLFLAAGGLFWLLRITRVVAKGRLATALTSGALVWMFSANVYHPSKKKHYGFDDLAKYLLPRADTSDFVTLVSADSTGEGAFVAELAMAERGRPRHVVLRASKDLAASDWMGYSYTLLYKTPVELLRHLERSRVAFIVVSPVLQRPPEDQQLLLSLSSTYPLRFELLGRYPQGNSPGTPPGSILLYRLRRDDAQMGSGAALQPK